MKTALARTLTVTFLLTVLPTIAQACTGTVLEDASNGDGAKTVEVRKGQHLSGLDHVLIDKAKGMLVCAGDTCYPAIVPGDDGPIEVVDLRGCTIAEAGSLDGHLERHEIVGAHAASDNQDERKKLIAAGVTLAAMANIAAPQIVVDDDSTAHVVGNFATQTDARDQFVIKHEGACQYTMTHYDKGGSFRIDNVNFSLLNGRRSWNDNHVEFATTSPEGAYTAFYRKVQNYSGLYLYVNRASSLERIVHNVEYMFKNGCDQSIVRDTRNPDDPY